MRKLAIIVLLIFGFAAPAQQIRLSSTSTVIINSEITGQTGEFIYVKADRINICWQTLDPGLKMVPLTYLKNDSVAIFFATHPGKYRIIAWQKDTRDLPSVAIINISDSVPPDPVPVPVPTPVPPDPVPVPDPAKPVAIKNLRIAVFYETSQKGKYPREQQLIFTSKSVLDYLDAHCTKSGYRFYDQTTTDYSKEAKVWQDVAKRPRASIPWLIVLDNETVILEQSLPVSDTEFLNLLKKYSP